jgi:predicted histone-like DNA-binding protein
MSLKYHLVERKDLRQDAGPDATIVYGQIRKTDTIPFDKVCAKISLFSSVTKGDVQNVIAGLLEVLKEHLDMGQCVQMGEMGCFRMSAGCKSVDTVDDFSTSCFRNGRIKFHPGKELREVQRNASFEKMLALDKSAECDKKHEGDEE